jgi:hypothetical protein
MYRLVETEEYRDELAAVAAGAERLEADLVSSVYFALQRDPFARPVLVGTDLRVWRRRVALGLFFVDVYYRVKEEEQAVSLVSIRRIDTTAF